MAVAGCGSTVQFERALGSGRYPAMPGNAAIAMATDIASLPQPTVVLGELRLAATKGSTPQGRAEELLLDVAGRYGCDAIAEVRQERVDAYGTKTGNPDADMEYQWAAKCVRTAKAEAIALAASPRPRAAAARPAVNTAEIEQKKLVAEAEKARKDAERLAALAAEKEKQAKVAAEAAEKERIRIEKAEKARLEAERKRREAEEEQRRREAEQAERERKRKEAEAEDRAKKEAEERARKEAEAADKELRKKEAEIDKARKDAEEKARKYAELTEAERKRKEAAAGKARKDAEDRARKDAEAAAEKERKHREAEAQKQAKADAKKAGDQAKRDAEVKAKQEADDKARKEVEDAARKEAEDRARREAEDKARKEAEDKARQVAEDRARREADAAARKTGKGTKDGKVVDWKVRFDAAGAEDTETSWLELLGAMPDGEDSDRAFERLQHAARARAGAWLSLDAAKVAGDEIEAAPVGDPGQLKRELAEAGATTSRFLVPREYAQGWTLRNPTRHPVVVDLRTATGRIVKLLDAGATASGTWKAPCPPLGPPLRSKVGLVLEYRFGCDMARNAPRLGAVRPARRDLAIDRKAGDPEASPETVARLWTANPATRLADVHLWAVEDAMRRRSDEVAQVSGKVAQGERTAAGGQAIKVELRNNSARDLTVIFEVGTGRDERLTVAHKSTESIRLELPPGKAPELHLKGVVPKLRSLDWLVGLWSFQGVSLVILPGQSGLQAWAVEPAAGDDASPKLHAFAVRLLGTEVVLEAEPPGLVALALFADKTPAACDKRCALAVKIKLTDQDRFIAGAGRVLLAVVEIPGKTGTFEFNADN